MSTDIGEAMGGSSSDSSDDLRDVDPDAYRDKVQLAARMVRDDILPVEACSIDPDEHGGADVPDDEFHQDIREEIGDIQRPESTDEVPGDRATHCRDVDWGALWDEACCPRDVLMSKTQVELILDASEQTYGLSTVSDDVVTDDPKEEPDVPLVAIMAKDEDGADILRGYRLNHRGDAI